jgi:3-isopropylmalate/(R)-2-methylmalate dehydratase small subunit
MTPFVQLISVAAPLPRANVDTDKIIAARFLKTIRREGLGTALFSALREDPQFVLNRAPWSRAGILIALDNFGCGSSREHAPWALLDFGIRCIIAPGFADIFYNNCFKNGILPIVLSPSVVNELLLLVSEPETACLTIDLKPQTVATQGGKIFTFDIDPRRKHDLLLGIDEIARSLGYSARISDFESKRLEQFPWLLPVFDNQFNGRLK